MRRLAITTGDPNGIGLEIALKALIANKAYPDVQWVIFKGKSGTDQLQLEEKYRIATTTTDQLVTRQFDPQELLLIEEDSNPAKWVEQASELCLNDALQGLATGPMSKNQPGAEGGHTQILQRFSSRPLYMGFFGQKLNVVLVTDHIPLKSVSASLTAEKLQGAIQTSATFGKYIVEKLYPHKSKGFQLGVIGLNPHAGEQGLLGDEELIVIEPMIQKFHQQGLLIEGPLVPDAWFNKIEQQKSAVLMIALYHDQGLIPFKLLHGQKSGIQISLGLPFIRTSVDHGVAADIFGKGIADPGSMIEAISALEVLSRDTKEWTKLYKQKFDS